jgi:DNA (cytosine-5)-methyltransferase 1
MPNHAGTSMCHPSQLRTLSVGEMAAVQEFPRDWEFTGSATEKCRQIGNAVPTRLGEVAGTVIKKMLGKIALLSSDTPKTALTPSRIVHIRPHVRTRSFWKNGKAFAGDVSYYTEEPRKVILEQQLAIAA